MSKRKVSASLYSFILSPFSVRFMGRRLLQMQPLFLLRKLSQLGIQQSAMPQTCAHLCDSMRARSSTLLGTSDLLRLICTCTKSPMYLERTTFTGTDHLRDVQAIPGFELLGSLGTPCASNVNVPACTVWQSSAQRRMTKHTLKPLETNRPSSKRNPTGGMVWCTQIMYWYCLSSSVGQNAHTGPVPAASS